MLSTNDFLGPCLRTLKRLTGARTVSLYLPATTGGDPGALLVHEGAPPVAELADLRAAEKLSREAETRPGGGAGWLRPFSSSSAEGWIVQVAAPDSLLSRFEGAPSAPASPARRSSDAAPGPPTPTAIWIGFRTDPGAVLELPAELSQPPDSDAWLRQALSLAAMLAWYAQQVGTVLNDSVSLLPGRAQFQAALFAAMKRAGARGQSLTLVLINPTDFVVVNENFGREAGDSVIREIAERLRGALRSSDLVGRYGGAVFSLGLPDTGPEVGRLVAEKLRLQLTEGAYLRGAVRLGFDCGVAAFEPEGDGAAATPLELMRRADRALNLAKQAPEGRVVNWQPDQEAAQVATLDRLSGIFTANLAKDYRNMLFLWDAVNIVSETSDFESLATRVVERLHATFKTERVALFAWSEADGFQQVEGLAAATAEATETILPATREIRLLEEARRLGDAAEGRLKAADGGERFCCAVPLVARQSCLGCLYLVSRGDSKTFDRSDLIFLRALAGQLAVTLDRSLLAAQERARQQRERQRLRSELYELREALQETRLVYRSVEMESIVNLLRRLAPTDMTLLITGESGTGKELLAHTAHALSQRSKRPFVVVDCGAIAAPLIERELFGHEKGAYTSAEKRGLGRLAEADGGTLVLDEIGELPLEVQTRFLRFAQERHFTPVGATRTRKVDVRLIAITNRDLEEEVAAGRFRADLYYRLSVAPVVIPPLRDRPDDILFLARHYLKKFAVQYQKGVRRLAPATEARLLEHPWPGNVRELQNRIMRAVILCEGEEIGTRELELVSRRAPAKAVEPRLPTASSAGVTGPEGAPAASSPAAWDALRLALGEQIEAAMAEEIPTPLGRWLAEDLVLEAHDAARGVRKRAATLLGIPATTFRRRLSSALAQSSAGLSPRPLGWNAVRPALSGVVRAADVRDDGAAPDNMLMRSRSLLLELVLARLPNDAAAGAALMGVTLPTFQSWAAEKTSDR